MKKLLILSLLLVFLAACQEKENNLIFYGTSENWSVQVTVSVMTGSENNKFELEYHGDDLGSFESFNYYLENTVRGTDFQGNNVSLNNNGIYTNEDLSSNSPVTKSTDTFFISIDWNGNREEIVLKGE